MADIGSIVSNIGTSISAGLGTTGVYVMYAGIILVLMTIVGVFLAYYLDKNSYKISVWIFKRRGGPGSDVFDLETGAMGKVFYDKQKKEVRFKIYKSKKRGFMYNNEAVDQKFFVKKFTDGKYAPLICMAPNEQGWLEPIHLQLAGGAAVAKVQNADLSYYQTELELMDALFNKKSFMEKYYLLILVILFIICICILWYMAGQVHKAAELNQQSALVMAEAMKYMAERFGNSTAQQVVHIG